MRYARSFGISMAAFALAATTASLAYAAGQYDGTWVIDVPPSASSVVTSANPSCPALRLPIQIKDSKVSGSLTRVPSVSGGPTVEAGTGRHASEVTGTVLADGTVHAQWQGYKAAGKLGDGTGTVTIKGECGPRKATATRVSG